jgi:hypothetical protein
VWCNRLNFYFFGEGNNIFYFGLCTKLLVKIVFPPTNKDPKQPSTNNPKQPNGMARNSGREIKAKAI